MLFLLEFIFSPTVAAATLLLNALIYLGLDNAIAYHDVFSPIYLTQVK